MRAALVHRVVGFATVALSAVHLIAVIATRGGIKPYSTLGWLNERLLVGGAVLLAGLLILRASRALAEGRRGFALVGCGLLALICSLEHLRSFAPMPLVFCFVALGDALIISGRRWSALPFAAGLAVALTFVVAAHRSRGDEPGHATPAPRDIVTAGADYDRFLVDTYLSSGVAPKKYFGFFDERGDTAAAEAELRDTVIRAVALTNAYAAEKNLDVRVTEKEVAVTFFAEGGALLFTTATDKLDGAIHPVRDEGLDNFRLGFLRFPTLVQTFDTTFGTGLGKLTAAVGASRVLLRPMTLREAVLATTLMYLFEKQLTHELRDDAKVPLLAGLPLDEQFVTTSLVYNCGLLFSDERVAGIVALNTADYLAKVNADNAGKRPALPVLSTAEATARLAAGESIPLQLTSWSAVYHVLQRYGAWVALAKFTTAFDASGAFTAR
ncbi:MAG: hypothetical protein JNK82_39165 [Myxococcaceae bacterium]|nr:hypothetical protein [Myxococcaceae bacterium]